MAAKKKTSTKKKPAALNTTALANYPAVMDGIKQAAANASDETLRDALLENFKHRRVVLNGITDQAAREALAAEWRAVIVATVYERQGVPGLALLPLALHA
jgi:hypothetical protein